MKREMYHTQEKRRKRLKEPILCKSNNAWLGEAYYFWYDEIDAINWGNKSKRITGFFEIYKAEINCKNVFDTVFNEEYYLFWVKQIEKIASKIQIKTNKKATLKELNSYLKNEAGWIKKIDGIMFQDLPNSEDLLVDKFYYRKRIQLAVYNNSCYAKLTLTNIAQRRNVRKDLSSQC